MKHMLKCHPEMIFAARHHHLPAIAWRTWFLAKGFDRGGSGFIPPQPFRQHLAVLGVSPSCISRWLAQAQGQGLLWQEEEVFALASWQQGAALAGLGRCMRAVCLPRDKILHTGWLAWCWAGVLAHFPNPISRQALQALTGVPPRTQQAYERAAGVVNHPNYAHYGSVSENPELAIHFYGQPGHFTRQGQLYQRLPNHRQAKGVCLAGIGRLDIINRALAEVAGSPHGEMFPKPLTPLPRPVRLYCATYRQVKRSLRRLSQMHTRPAYLFLRGRLVRGRRIYHAQEV